MLFECENVNLVYDQDKSIPTYALKNINLMIEECKFIGILGPSGSGKSSLLYILAGLKRPSKGKVMFKGTEYSSIDDSKMSRMRKDKFGFIFQKHFLIDYMSVLDNVLSVINDSSKEKVEKAMYLLEKLGIKDTYNKKPYQISGGQSQRAAVARALINDPEVIFADEPTASLDHKNVREVMDFLKVVRKNSALIVVTHDPTAIEGADTIINLWDGSIKETR